MKSDEANLILVNTISTMANQARWHLYEIGNDYLGEQREYHNEQFRELMTLIVELAHKTMRETKTLSFDEFIKNKRKGEE